jgi:type I restriction-modification system DNA methylase subunit
MDTTQAQRLIRDLFSQRFDQDRYRYFLRNLLNEFEPRGNHYAGNLIPDAFKSHVRQYWRVGKYMDPGGDGLDLLVVEVKNLSKLDRARTALRNFAVNRLKQFEKEASLIAFYAKDDGGVDWRFSFVKIEHKAYRGAGGKIKLKQQLTPAKRYSYLVGEHENSHTACRQLLPLLTNDYADPHIKEIETAFSIEKVTNEFFGQYKILFQKLAQQLKKQNNFQQANETEASQAVSRFAKKLLGQIVFIYFLQKKGWMGVPANGRWGEGSRRFLWERFEKTAANNGNYYNVFLQHLFYDALACDRKDQPDPGYYARFACRVPFLDGGLFEADYDWKSIKIDLPNRLFHNDEKSDAGDDGTGILDVFNRYNFTIKEDEPLDKEVAVDPEMLGKVFENMLEITERKSKGAYYTPREIVHYICQESLIHYLDNKLNLWGDKNRKGYLKASEAPEGIQVPKKDLEVLAHKGHLALENDQRIINKGEETKNYRFQLPETVRNYASKIDKALAEIKVCDPAIGSGAFPVGFLHEIVNARLALAPHSGNAKSVYELKRHAISESLYGVDSDASAIDIARLRLWLSLIVDEQSYDTIEALPNLDYKIVKGNSLIEAPSDALGDTKIQEKLEGLKKQFFNETDGKRKQKLREKINSTIDQLLSSISNWVGYSVDFDFRLFFSEVWHEKGGFDVVIGNPPYVQIQKFSGRQIQKDWGKQQYETFAKTGDIYCLFYEKGHRLLRQNGVLAFITSNKWMRAAYGQKLRQFFRKRTAIRQLIDFGDSPIFSEATTYTNIMLFEKAASKVSPRAWDLSSAYQKATSLLLMLDENPEGAALFDDEGFVIVPPELAAIKKRVEEIGTPLKKWDVSICRGILTGFNEAFIIDSKRKDELIAMDPKSANIIKPILRGRDIKRYKLDFAHLWIINSHNGYDDVPTIDINQYPKVKAHLEKIESQRVKGRLGKKAQNAKGLFKRDDQGKTPFNLRHCAYLEELEREKIVYAEIVFDSAFFFDTSGTYAEATAFVLTGEDSKPLTALLNSQLLTFAFRAFYAGGDLRGDTFRYKKVFLQNLPVVKVGDIQKHFLEILVDYVQTVKASNLKLQAAYFEQLIDGLVYELYFAKEIKTAGKEIFRYLDKLPPLTAAMSASEKLAVIQREFDRLYDPRHPVRNHVETLDSVEVVRTIREALKR